MSARPAQQAPQPARAPARRRLLGAALAPVMLLSVAVPAAAASATGATTGSATSVDGDTVTYRGLRLTVPQGWRVVDLEKDPEACLRLDKPTLYLGHAGGQSRCTGRAVAERADTLHLEPATGAPWRADIPTVNVSSGTDLPDSRNGAPSNEVRYALKQAGLLATVSYAAKPDAVERVVEKAEILPTARPAAPQRPVAPPRSAAAAASFVPGAYRGAGFDACTAPTQSQMNTWRASSPYRAVGIYIGGAKRACAQPQLSAEWVRAQAAAGWHQMPIWVDKQPEKTLPDVPSQAAALGRKGADDAVATARNLGFDPGTVIYSDIEHYNNRSRWDKPVLSYLDAWTERVHQLGYRSGAYVHALSGIKALSANYGSGTYSMPDVVWAANWNGVAGVGDGSMGLPEGTQQWTNGRRVHQYKGQIAETYGGVRLEIDRNYVDVGASRELGGMHDLVSGDFTGDGKTDVVGVESESGKLWLYAGDGKGSIGGGPTRKEIGTGGWNGMQDLAAGDFNGDGKTDLIGVERSSGILWLYAGDGTGSIGGGSTRKQIGTNWTSMQNLVAGDFNEDGKTDLIGVETDSGELFFYAGDGTGDIGGESTRKRIGTNWTSMQSLTAGDFNGDGKTDLIGVEKDDEGKLFLYAGDGTGSIGGGSTRKQIGTNWDSMRGLTAGEFTGDGKTDLLAVESGTKKLFLYAGDGTGNVGGQSTRKEIGTNW
ncbi:glycoside hydrolase domain-containing protein [Streptomyces sp. MST-110588]|uniref:glycoside hydrolase domain-containing protein n=1 Tax=Streptomyces sp. MST-110588 TaxID=2833628 RepID=UPI001F5CA992|nr:glycoside hydrolase domain-containing protein [Streptomyces sp. MST-110588]UNO41738.1 DUF1906 domain-containing protein [Streptomyces sp. MST-110588]